MIHFLLIFSFLLLTHQRLDACLQHVHRFVNERWSLILHYGPKEGTKRLHLYISSCDNYLIDKFVTYTRANVRVASNTLYIHTYQLQV